MDIKIQERDIRKEFLLTNAPVVFPCNLHVLWLNTLIKKDWKLSRAQYLCHVYQLR